MRPRRLLPHMPTRQLQTVSPSQLCASLQWVTSFRNLLSKWRAQLHETSSINITQTNTVLTETYVNNVLIHKESNTWWWRCTKPFAAMKGKTYNSLWTLKLICFNIKLYPSCIFLQVCTFLIIQLSNSTAMLAALWGCKKVTSVCWICWKYQC